MTRLCFTERFLVEPGRVSKEFFEQMSPEDFEKEDGFSKEKLAAHREEEKKMLLENSTLPLRCPLRLYIREEESMFTLMISFAN